MMGRFELTIQYRFTAEDYADAIRKARDLGFLDESHEVEVVPTYEIKEI